MKNLFVLLVCALMFSTASVAVAQPAPDNGTSLRDNANAAGDAANSEANAPSSGEVAEEVTELVAGSGDDAAAAEDGTPVLDADSGADDVVVVVQAMVEAFKGGNYGLGMGLLFMFLVWFMRSFKIPFLNTTLLHKIPAKATPWVAAGLGILASVGTELMAGQLHPVMATVNGFFIGATTIGLWEIIGKQFLPVNKGEEEAAAADA